VNITLLPEHEEFVQDRLQNGQYKTIDEIFSHAIALLIESDIEIDDGLIHDSAWIESARQKIDAARVSIKANGGNDGDAAVAGLLDRYCFGGFHQLDLVG
jgi:antitoxin ParD1/3/4